MEISQLSVHTADGVLNVISHDSFNGFEDMNRLDTCFCECLYNHVSITQSWRHTRDLKQRER